MLRTSASSSMTRIVKGVAADGSVLPGPAGLPQSRDPLRRRAGDGLRQHAVDELPHLAQVEGLQEMRSAGPFEKRALLAAQHVAREEEDAPAQFREPLFELGVEALAVEDASWCR